MQLSFEIHKYAPELNKVYAKVPRLAKLVLMPTDTGWPNMAYDDRERHRKLAQEYRKTLSRPRIGRYASIAVQYCKEDGTVIHQRLYSGYVSSYAALLDFIKQLRVRHGLPNTVVKLESIKYIP